MITHQPSNNKLQSELDIISIIGTKAHYHYKRAIKFISNKLSYLYRGAYQITQTQFYPIYHAFHSPMLFWILLPLLDFTENKIYYDGFISLMFESVDYWSFAVGVVW